MTNHSSGSMITENFISETCIDEEEYTPDLAFREKMAGENLWRERVEVASEQWAQQGGYLPFQ